MEAPHFKYRIYIALFISFVFLVAALIMSYNNIKESSDILKYLSRDQIKFNYYAHKLNYDLKKHQTEVLQLTLLHKDFSKLHELDRFSSFQSTLEKLQTILQKTHEDSQEFTSLLLVIKKRIVAYKIVQHSLEQAVNQGDLEDIQDALIGFNAITSKFSKDTNRLIDLANAQLYTQIIILGKSNDSNTSILVFLFLMAVFLIIFSAYKFTQLHEKVREQLHRTKKAEEELKEAQVQLLNYNSQLESEITKKTEELHEKIYTHFLSGLPNRNKLFEDVITYKFTHIAIINIDKFQSFNDVYGEEVGNVALQLSADFLRQETQKSDFYLYHIGGDEFVIASNAGEHLAQNQFIAIIEDILKHFKAETFVYEDKRFQFNISSGIAFGKPNKKILAYADMALKDAKKRNIQLSVFDEDKELEKLHQEDIECHKKLLHAIDNDKVVSYYQPIVPIQEGTKKITKYESLVRIIAEDGQVIPPFNFIKVAKNARIYYKITRVVINNALHTIEKYQVPCSINFSLTDINNQRTIKYFFDKLHEFKFNELLTVELLETEDFQDYQKVYDFCMDVRSYGVKIALDDFGSGYSNFSHILHLPVDFIKIDASLISNIDRDHNSRIMVETIVDLAKKLHVATIAEFVSSGEILAVVKALGVDYAQGYYLGKPLAINEYIKT